ncbi:hypothetical protein PLEOSDRAFT_159677 [Pleurotus ostreatus PC15]|uniref:Uncharacterized protein n=1 Tax=Pleurotus ostreatus (strain PC15) TaxID=1137138 RepID=A0A067NEF3_PLEO1|nr:hypothetical protein PLEOSDRAFT_159677 [Pleurotus ostreatus PC15]
MADKAIFKLSPGTYTVQTSTNHANNMGPNHDQQHDSGIISAQDITPATEPTHERTPAIAHKLPKPLPVPSVAYGLTITNDVAFAIGCHYVPPSDKDNENPWFRRFAERIGRKFLNSYCQKRFPDIPLRWRQPVVAVLPHSQEVPLLMLGRRGRCAKTGKVVNQIFVNKEQVQVLKDALGLDKEEPKWYRVAISE